MAGSNLDGGTKFLDWDFFVVVIFPTHTKQMPEWYFEFGHDRFFPCPFHFIHWLPVFRMEIRHEDHLCDSGVES
jgi:hypothetical protein